MENIPHRNSVGFCILLGNPVFWFYQVAGISDIPELYRKPDLLPVYLNRYLLYLPFGNKPVNSGVTLMPSVPSSQASLQALLTVQPGPR